MMRRIAGTATKAAPATLGAGTVVTAAALVLAGCASSQPQPGKNHQVTALHSAQVGTALPVSDSSGTKLDVTVEKVIDPASGANQYSNPASGKHFVAVKLRVRNTAAITYQNNANNETTIVLFNGKTGHANYNPIAGCGNFSNGQIKLASHASATGCVTFQVPNGQKITKVRYHNTVFPGTTAEWHLP
jgi:uncharacterized protein DUF4352